MAENDIYLQNPTILLAEIRTLRDRLAQTKNAEPVATVKVFHSAMCNGRKMAAFSQSAKQLDSLPVGDYDLFIASK